jgi:hypothetical protein
MNDTTKHALQTNAALQTMLAKTTQTITNHLLKIAEQLGDFINWKQLDDNRQRLIEQLGLQVEEAAAYFIQVTQTLNAEPFVISKPLYVNRVNHQVFPREEGDVSIAHYKRAPGFSPSSIQRASSSPSSSPHDKIVWSQFESYQHSPTLSRLSKLGSALHVLYQEAKRIFFTNYEMTAELANPLIKAMKSLQSSILMIQPLLGIVVKQEHVVPIITSPHALTSPPKKASPSKHDYRLSPFRKGSAHAYRRLLQSPKRHRYNLRKTRPHTTTVLGHKKK